MFFLTTQIRRCPNCEKVELEPHKIYCSKCEHKIPNSVQELIWKKTNKKAHFAE